MESSSPPDKPECWFIFQNERLMLVRQSDKLQLPPHDLALMFKHAFIRQHHLGIFNEITCFCAEITPDLPPLHPFELVSLRKAFEILGEVWYAAAVKAYSVLTWDRNHRFCGHCGRQTYHKVGAYERACHHCGLSVYPRISPSVIVLIRKGEELLMARSPHFTPGAYGLIAGFVEAGESLEDTVHREVQEEVSIRIKNLQYFGSQPWPFPDSLMVGFTADYASGDIVIDAKELETAGWYRYDNLPGRPSTRISISGKLIDHFIAEQTQKNLK